MCLKLAEQQPRVGIDCQLHRQISVDCIDGIFLKLVKTVIATATLLIVNIQTNVLQVMVHCFPFFDGLKLRLRHSTRVSANQGACEQYSQGKTGTHFIGPVNGNRKTNQNQTRVSPNLLVNPFYATKEDCMGRYYYLHCISSLTSMAVSNSGPVVLKSSKGYNL